MPEDAGNPEHVIYDYWDPFVDGITHLAVMIDARQPYVCRTYYIKEGDKLPEPPLGAGIFTVSSAIADFKFRKGTVDVLASP